jgi:hypothetical protein
LVDRQTYRDFLVYRGPVFRAQVMPRKWGAENTAIDMAPATSPAIPAIKTALCATSAAATPTISCGRNDAIVGPKHCGPQPANSVDTVVFGVQAKAAHSFPFITPSSSTVPSGALPVTWR